MAHKSQGSRWSFAMVMEKIGRGVGLYGWRSVIVVNSHDGRHGPLQ